ncbi:hypothetical protein CIG19_20125 [Enterobacterales bacterium CwR94]|nr:hypothetical protein CIG19_20125 [Enterobacterales bacterium CwR94]
MLRVSGLWKLRLMFPELTEAEFQVLMYYAFGGDNESTSDILKCSVSCIKQAQKRIREKLGLEKLDSARSIYHARTQAALIATDDFVGNYYEVMYKKTQPQRASH